MPMPLHPSLSPKDPTAREPSFCPPNASDFFAPRFALLLCLLPFLGCYQGTVQSATLQERPHPKPPAKDQAFVRFLDRPTPAFSGYCGAWDGKGRWLVVFVSRFCAPCHRLLARLEKAQASFEKAGIRIAIWLTDGEDCLRANAARGALQQAAYSWIRQEDAESWGVSATPTMYFVEKGRLRVRIDGDLPIEALWKSLSFNWKKTPRPR